MTKHKITKEFIKIKKKKYKYCLGNQLKCVEALKNLRIKCRIKPIKFKINTIKIQYN